MSRLGASEKGKVMNWEDTGFNGLLFYDDMHSAFSCLPAGSDILPISF